MRPEKPYELAAYEALEAFQDDHDEEHADVDAHPPALDLLASHHVPRTTHQQLFIVALSGLPELRQRFATDAEWMSSTRSVVSKHGVESSAHGWAGAAPLGLLASDQAGPLARG